MDEESKNKLIKEICIHENCSCNLEWLISQTNNKYNCNITKEDFSIRVANTPEEACYIGTIIRIPKSEEQMLEEDVKYLAKEYDNLLKDVSNNNPIILDPRNLENIKSWNELRNIIN